MFVSGILIANAIHVDIQAIDWFLVAFGFNFLDQPRVLSANPTEISWNTHALLMLVVL